MAQTNSETLELTDFSERLRQLAVARQDVVLAQEGKLCLYFDTHDVRRAILGAREYIKTDRPSEPYVDKQAFNQPDALPACLMAGGFLGPFTMLAPHQHELLRQMQTADAFSRAGKAKLGRETFLREVGITEPWGSDGGQSHDAQALRRILSKYAGKSTERFYKAIQCIRHPWWRQLSRLRASKTLVANGDTFDYPKLLSSKLLPRIVEAFNKRRGTNHNHHHALSHNNFADSMCMLMLIELVSRFNAGTSKVVPRFFVGTTKLFQDAAKIAGVESRLEVKVDGVKTSVLVGFDYIMLRASLKAHTLSQDDVLAQLSEDFNQNFRRGQDLKGLQAAMHRQGVRPLPSRFDQLLNYSFLENVWLSTIAEDELRTMAVDWTADLINTAQFREVVETAISEVSGEVLKGADEYKRFSATWLGLRSEIVRWRSNTREDHSGLMAPVDTDVHGLSLFRISPAEHVVSLARQMLDALGDEGHDDNAVFATAAWTGLLSSCASGGRSRNAGAQPSQDELEAAMAVLWCIGAFGRTAELYNQLSLKRRTYTAKTACAAAMLKLGREPRETEALIEAVARDTTPVGRVSDLGDSDVRIAAERSSSLGYLWFHLWQLRWGMGAWWRLREQDMPAADHPDYDRLLRHAISAVNVSWNYIKVRSEPFENLTARKIYVANQCLYYLVELGDESELEQMDAMQERLTGYKAAYGDYWRQTYSDTLSRYFAFRAERTNSAEHWADYMRFAKQHYRDAQNAAKSESTVHQFGAYLLKRAEKGFVGRVVRPGQALPDFRNTKT